MLYLSGKVIPSNETDSSYELFANGNAVGNTETLTGHIGDSGFELAMVNFTREHDCLILQADGDELQHIFRRISNLPHSDSRVQTWSGDFAWFIANNW